MKIIVLKQFSNLGIFSYKNFEISISIAMEVPIDYKNFKQMRSNMVSLGYFHNLIKLYKIQNMEISPFFISEKKQKIEN